MSSAASSATAKASKAPIVRARAVAPGRLVHVRLGDLPEPPNDLPPETEILCLKAVRHGKGFLNHYLVPLDDRMGPPEAMLLIGVDTDTPLMPAAEGVRLELTPATGTAAACGQILENPSGRFLKVREAYKDAFSLAYVELSGGDIRRRQERSAQAVYDWRIVGDGEAAMPATGRDEPGTPAQPAESRPMSPPAAPTAASALSVRRMTAMDVKPAAALLAERGLAMASTAERRIAALLSSPLAVCHVAEAAGTVLGVALGHYDGFHVHLSHVAVAANRERQGVGRALVEATWEAAVARGAEGVLADARLTATPFFQALGFRMGEAVLLKRDLE